MNFIKRAFILLLAFVCAALPAFARIRAEQPVSLTIEFVNGGTALSGARFDIYYAARYSSLYGYEVAEPFAGYFTIEGFEDHYGWDALAQQMADHVGRIGAEPTESGVTNANGRVRFPASGSAPLAHGLYLVVGHDVEQSGNTYTSLPFLVLLPSWDGETASWVYAVLAAPKSGLVPPPTPTPAPGETPTPEPGETPTPAPGETPTPEPGETPTPEPGETPTPTPTPGETPTPTPEPTGAPTPQPTSPPSPPTGMASTAAFGITALALAAAILIIAKKRSAQRGIDS